MQVFQIVQITFTIFLSFLNVSLKREIRNELVNMPLVKGPIFIQNIFFLPVQPCELVKFYVFKTSYDFSG